MTFLLEKILKLLIDYQHFWQIIFFQWTYRLFDQWLQQKQKFLDLSNSFDGKN